MNREPKIRRIQPPICRSLCVASFALLLSLVGSPSAEAASFRCPRHASASERLVCDTPALSELDDKLADLYRRAVEANPDATALEADRVSQWQWRQHNCKDKACVTDWYNRRIAELEGDFRHGKEATTQQVKDGVVEQSLAPDAQRAVLEMKGIAVANDGEKGSQASSTDAGKGDTGNTGNTKAATPLHLHKMPSGNTADASQKSIAETTAHDVLGALAAAKASSADAPSAHHADGSAAIPKAAGIQ